jgi:hypothetical protein
MPQYLFVVARGHTDLFEYLKERFADDENVDVILDRRGVSQSVPAVERRQKHPEVTGELRERSYAVINLC